MRALTRRILSRYYKPILQKYLTKDRNYRFEGLDLQVQKGVFHPAFFGSSKVFASFLKRQDLSQKKVLEIGCGSGLLSLLMARAGAEVWALDVNPAAVSSTEKNALRNELTINLFHSDIFEVLPNQAFDRIIINPPFFEGTPQNMADYAWYAGEDFRFFQRFFADLNNFIHSKSKIWMILSETCALDAIEQIAQKAGYSMKITDQSNRIAERFLIFSIQPMLT